MENLSSLGRSLVRGDAVGKAAGRIRFTDDFKQPGALHAALVTSPHAHAEIVGLDCAAAAALPGVRAVFTGGDFDVNLGLHLDDRPVLARGRVRFHGEPVAAVLADDELAARRAATLVRVEYKPLPVVNGPREALRPESPVLHPELASYRCGSGFLPEPGTNIAHRTRIRAGDVEGALSGADVVVEGEYSMAPGDNAAMEPRAAQAEMTGDGRFILRSSTQSAFGLRALLARVLGVPEGRICVRAEAAGGASGGTAGLHVEALACLLSKAVGGRTVRLVNARESELLSSPGRPGLEARVRLGALSDGRLVGADIELFFDSGGYAGFAVDAAAAAGYACCGPYSIPNVKVDSLCLYTNHPPASGGCMEVGFVVERAMDGLAAALKMDPAELRLRNAALAGHFAPGGSPGDLPACLRRVMERLDWAGGLRSDLGGGRVRAKGLACFWEPPAVPAVAGAAISFNGDGSVNLSTGVVDTGQGVLTCLRQIAAEALRMDPAAVHVPCDIDTDRSPHDRTTTAGSALVVAGKAVLEAAGDALCQIREIAAAVLRCGPGDLEVAGGRVFVRSEPEASLPLESVALGYVHPNGEAVGGPVMGRGRHVAGRLVHLDERTGQARACLAWTLGVAGVEVEVDLNDGTFGVLQAACCIDVGRLVNPALARGSVVGAMARGLGLATREALLFDSEGRVRNASLRDFKILRCGDVPPCSVDFIETPQCDGPFGARGLGERAAMGVPAALASALGRALGRQVDRLPVTAESLWNLAGGGSDDA